LDRGGENRTADGEVCDETGCGDQTTATLCALLSQGPDMARAVRTAILAGTLQFHRRGIQPVTREELDAYLQ
jgi:sugar/nucleoside kinase (ribokinase family)